MTRSARYFLFSGAGRVAVVPDFHVDVNALVEWVVVLEALVGCLNGLHSAFDLATLHIFNLCRDGALSKAASRVFACIARLPTKVKINY